MNLFQPPEMPSHRMILGLAYDVAGKRMLAFNEAGTVVVYYTGIAYNNSSRPSISETLSMEIALKSLDMWLVNIEDLKSAIGSGNLTLNEFSNLSNVPGAIRLVSNDNAVTGGISDGWFYYMPDPYESGTICGVRLDGGDWEFFSQ